MKTNPNDVSRIVLVTRKTQLEELVTRFATAPQARFFLEHAGTDFAPIQNAHDTYQRALEAVNRAIPRDMKVLRIEREQVPFTEFDDDLVIALGPDGLVSNTAKYLPTQMLIGVNPDPAQFDGVLLPFAPDEAAGAIALALDNKAVQAHVSLAQAVSRDGHSLLAFNDLFIGAASHVSARYELHHAGKTERQSSSGIIVSTGAGSTGWLRSVLTGAGSIDALANGRATPSPANHTLPWDTNDLIYCVREPFPSKMSGTTLAYGVVNSNHPLEVTSHMASGGVIFSDGIQSDAIPFETGSIVSVGIAQQKAHLVVQ